MTFESDSIAPIGRREARRRAIQNDLISTGLALFTARGFDAVTVEDIAHATGVSRRTFFRHFATKEDVIFAWMRTEGELMKQFLRERSTREPLRTTISQALLKLADYHDRTIGAPRMEIGLALEVSSLRDRYYGEARKWQTRFEEIVIDHRGEAEAAALSVEMQMAAGVAAYMAAVLHWSKSGGEGTLRAWVSACLEALWGDEA